MANRRWQKIIINDLTGGLTERYYDASSPNSRKVLAPNQYNRGVLNPFQIPGLICPPAGAETDFTNTSVVTNSILKFAAIDDNTMYAAEAGSNFHEIEIGTNTITSPVFAQLAAGGTTHTGHSTFEIVDFMPYNASIGNLVLFKDGTDGDVARIETDGTVTMDYFSDAFSGGQALTTSVARLELAPNGFVYIFDGNAIHKMDMANTTAQLSVMDLSVGSLIADTQQYGDLILIGVNHLPTATTSTLQTPMKKDVYVWDYLSVQGGDTDGFEKIIPVLGAGKIEYVLVIDGQPYVLTRTNAYCELNALRNGVFRPVKRLGPNDYMYSKWSIAYHLGSMIWTSNSNGIFAYSNTVSKDGKYGLYQIEDAIHGGALINGNTSGLFFFGKGGNITQLSLPVSQSSGNTVTVTDSNDPITDVYDLPFGSDVHMIEVRFPQFSSGSTTEGMDIKVYLNRETIASDTLTVTADNGAKGWAILPYHKRNVHSIQLEFVWDALAFNKSILPATIIVYFEPTTRTR